MVVSTRRKLAHATIVKQGLPKELVRCLLVLPVAGPSLARAA